MRALAVVVGLSCASIVCSTLCGCSWRKLLPAEAPTLPNAVAVDRALRLCSLTEGDQPFHLILEISPPAGVDSPAATPSRYATARPSIDPATAQMHATIEIFWLNAITYRTEIQSPGFRQTRIVDGKAVEEHDSGGYYPRWIQDFVAGILNPIPEAAHLSRIPGEIPVGLNSEACISTPAGNPSPGTSLDSAQLCFRDAEPRIAGFTNARRSLWFDDYAPFGSQQIPRTIVDHLQPDLLLRGRIVRLEPLAQSRYPLLRAMQFTSRQAQLTTAVVSPAIAQSLLQVASARYAFRSASYQRQLASQTPPPDLTRPPAHHASPSENPSAFEQTPIYIRTDRSGRVREAYRSTSDQYGVEKAALLRAFTLQFKPLIFDGAPHQMEALIYVPASDPAEGGSLNDSSPRRRPVLSSPAIVQNTPGFADSTHPSHARPASPEMRAQIPSFAAAPQTARPDQPAVPPTPTPDR